MNIPFRLRLSPRSRRFFEVNSWVGPSVLRAMGAKLSFLTYQNFGFSGKDRPEPWRRLTAKYAKRVKRDSATLDLKGRLLRSLRLGQPQGNRITVTADCEYASFHQFGNPKNNLPRRAFFPVTLSGQLTPFAQRQISQAAVNEILKLSRNTR